MPELCTHCGMTPLPKCINSHVLVAEGTCQECPNMRLVRMVKEIHGRMTPEMLEIPHVKESPLYTPRSKSEAIPPVDRTKDNLHIKGITRRGLLAHLKLVVTCQPLRYSLIDDAFLLEVFLGKQQYTNRPKDVRESIKTYNSVHDLIGSDFDLVILTVGIQSYKNVASPHQLLEVLKRRKDVYAKPTWILEPPGVDWKLSRNDDVDVYLAEHFKVVELTPIAGIEGPIEDSMISYEGDDTQTIESYPKVPNIKRRKVEITETPNLDASDFATSLSDGVSSKKPKYKKNWGK